MDGPLTPEHTAQLAAAMARAGRIRKASRMAAVNGWVLAISAGLTAPFAELMAEVTIAAYASIILLTVLLQGAMARFYHDRIALVRDHVAETPDWVAEVVLLAQDPHRRS